MKCCEVEAELRKLEEELEEEKIVCVLVVHNEENYLPYSIPSLVELGCKVVVILDRCNDSSEGYIRTYLRNSSIFIKVESKWDNSLAEAKSVGCDIAKILGADLILMSDADIELDVDEVKKAIRLTSDFPILVLTYKDYSLFGSAFFRIIDEAHNLFGRIVRKLGIQPVRFGIYIVRAENAYIEDKESEYDYLQQKNKTTWVATKTRHLRPRWNISSQIHRGICRARLPQYSFLKLAFNSFLLFQPFTIVGFMKEKFRSK